MPGSRSAVHSVTRWVFMAAGVPIESAIGDEDGEFLKFEKASEDWGYKGSANGFGTFYTKGNKLVRASLTLPQDSPDNQKLMAIHLASLEALAPFPCAYGDGLGTSKGITDSSVIEKTPDETVAVEPGTVVWVFLMHDPARFVGGH